MAGAPDILASTREERARWVRGHFACIADCDACGLCASFHGRDPETALAAYVEGTLDYRACLRAARI